MDTCICAKCLSDEDLQQWIEDQDGDYGCDVCGQKDARTTKLDELASYMRDCLCQFYGFAVNQLPYESREGGYQGWHCDTFDLLFDHIGIDLPRDRKDFLRHELPDRISEETWCEYDWLSLDLDEALKYGWEKFCQITMHQRRFFFHKIGEPDDREDFTPEALLGEIAVLAGEFGLIVPLSEGTHLYRARPGAMNMKTAEELGPPPENEATQSNRMNPPGIPMFYSAEDDVTAIEEVWEKPGSLGKFVTRREAWILDLSDLPSIPGIFSGVQRRDRLGLVFLHGFTEAIISPVARDDRAHVDYVPSQIVTEYFRANPIDRITLDGIRYPSVAHPGGRNVVLFGTQENVGETGDFDPEQGHWIELVESRSYD